MLTTYFGVVSTLNFDINITHIYTCTCSCKLIHLCGAVALFFSIEISTSDVHSAKYRNQIVFVCSCTLCVGFARCIFTPLRVFVLMWTYCPNLSIYYFPECRYILIYPQGCDVCNHLSLFLCVANHDKLLPGTLFCSFDFVLGLCYIHSELGSFSHRMESLCTIHNCCCE